MANRAHSTGRRMLLAAPIALAAFLPPTVPAAAETCFELGQVVRAYQRADRSHAHPHALAQLGEEIDAASAAVLAAPVRSVADLSAKLSAALGRLNYSEEHEDNVEGGRAAAAAIRHGLAALSDLAGPCPADFGLDFFDHDTWLAAHRGRA